MFTKRTKTIPFSSFMDGSYKQQERTKREQLETVALLTATPIVCLLTPDVTHASVGDRIMRAFDPIIELIQSMSYPVAFIFITGGCLLIMTGQKSRGFRMMKYAGIGYLAMQLVPGMMDILVEIGKELRQ